MRRRKTGSRSRSETIGAIRWKLFDMLREAGVPIVSVDQFWMQEGFYRGKYCDLARWGAGFKVGSDFWRVYSWNTMTECVRNGFTVQYHAASEVEVYANPPKPKRVREPKD